MKQTVWGPIPDDGVDDVQYKAAQHPEIQRLMELTDGPAKDAQVTKCIGLGLSIDKELHINDGYPYFVMVARETQGIAYIAPAQSADVSYGAVSSDYPGAIRVSSKAADYPPYSGPMPDRSLVGPAWPGKFDKPVHVLTDEARYQLEQNNLKIGQHHPEHGGTWRLEPARDESDMPKAVDGSPAPYWVKVA